MNAERLLQHFDRISEAPDAIPRLRRFILDLAVRGKLVEQDPSDEPAEELLKRIQAENERLVTEGEIRKGRSFNVNEREHSLGLPSSWVWLRLEQLIPEFQNGVSSRGDVGGILTVVLRLADIVGGRISQENPRTIPIDKKSVSKYRLSVGDILVVRVNGSEEIVGRFVLCHQETDAVYCDHFIRMRIRREWFSPYYLGLLGISPLIREQIASLFVTTAGQKTVNQEHIRSLRVPLPPLAEQHRIVTKVDELMALCDQLEAAKTEREQNRDRLVAASLHRLHSPADTAETDALDLTARQTDAYRDHTRFVFNHLPRLTTRPEHIKQLRQTIINLAVRGKLVPQDPNDEPAERLLEKITSERNAKKMLDSVTKSDEDEFRKASRSLRLPDDWVLVPLVNVALTIVDCPHSTPRWVPAGMLCVRTNQFRPGFLDLSDSRFVSKATFLERIQRLKPMEGDILYSREGGILGVACRVPPNTELCLGQRMMLIRPPSDINSAFLEMLLNSPLITEIAREKTTGGAAPRVNVSTVKAYPIPLPPLAEQHRIVARVTELMALCDELEGQLTTTEDDSRRLLEAVLHEALHPPLEATEQTRLGAHA